MALAQTSARTRTHTHARTRAHTPNARSLHLCFTQAAAAQQQVQAGPSADERSLRARFGEVEGELRKAKRAEQKLQALLYRLKKDVATSGGDLATLFDSLQASRLNGC
jgi:septal ring factor EnvC (AmiA/AmiB activator)